MITVFVAAFLAGGTGAVGVNRFIDVTRTRAKATVECEPIFVAIRDLPAGNPVTVWDVKLRDWPKAMVPQAALRPGSFDGIAWPEGHVARLSLREGQPVLRSHLRSMIVDVPPAVPQVAAATATATGPVAVAEPEPIVEPTVNAVAQVPIAQHEIAQQEISQEKAERSAEPLVLANTTPAAAPTATAEPEATAAAEPTPSDLGTGEGWPSTAETAAGSEAAMRFLVVPERIAIMADELTSPRKPQPPASPVASVATQPRPAIPSPTPSPNVGQTPQPKAEQRPKPAAPPRQPPAESKAVTKPPLPRAKYPDQAPTAKPRPKGGMRAPTPRVTVEPDAESQLADEAARTPSLKTVFPNMAAGLEKLESEMSRVRRERVGSLFRSSSVGGEEVSR